MITRVAIDNFQSLRDVTLDLGRITTIVGPSDSGKSGFLRALRAVVENRRGAEYISHGASSCEIVVTVEESQVKWKRTKSAATYELIQGEQSQKFEKTKANVPLEIANIFKIVPDENITLQFSTQYDAPFLVDQSGTVQASRFVVGLSGFELFNQCSGIVKADIAERQVSLKSKQETIQELDRVLNYIDVEDVRIALDQAIKLENRFTEEDKNVGFMQALSALWVHNKSVLELISGVSSIDIPSMGVLDSECSVCGEMNAVVVGYERLMSEQKVLCDELELVSGVLSSIKIDTGLAEVVKTLNSLELLNEEWKLAVKACNGVESEFRQCEDSIQKLDKMLLELEPRLKQYCPYYGQSIPEGVEYECVVPKT